ncbi:MAG: transposase [Glaciimonas sp.]|nr:transposase [Glaciimonas sp.]
MTTGCYGLDDAQWEQIKGLLPAKAGDVGEAAEDNRLFVEAVLYSYCVKTPWRNFSERFGL